MSDSAVCRAYGFAINVDTTPFPEEIFDSLPEQVQKDLLEDHEGITEFVPRATAPHVSEEFGFNMYDACIREKLRRDFPLLTISVAGDDADDSPWLVVCVKSTAQSSKDGIPFIPHYADGSEDELFQLNEFIGTFFPGKEATQLVWSYTVY